MECDKKKKKEKCRLLNFLIIPFHSMHRGKEAVTYLFVAQTVENRFQHTPFCQRGFQFLHSEGFCGFAAV